MCYLSKCILRGLKKLKWFIRFRLMQKWGVVFLPPFSRFYLKINLILSITSGVLPINTRTVLKNKNFYTLSILGDKKFEIIVTKNNVVPIVTRANLVVDVYCFSRRFQIKLKSNFSLYLPANQFQNNYLSITDERRYPVQ